MASPTKTGGRSLLAWTSLATGNVTVGTWMDVSALLALSIVAHFSRNPASGVLTTGWPNLRLEGSTKVSGEDDAFPLAIFSPVPGTSLANTTLNGAVAAGATTCTVNSASNIGVGDLLFLGHTTDTTKYEIVRVRSVVSATITFEEACNNAHDNGATVTDQAEVFAVPYLDVSSIMRVRVVFDNANSGRTNAARVLAASLDTV